MSSIIMMYFLLFPESSLKIVQTSFGKKTQYTTWRTKGDRRSQSGQCKCSTALCGQGADGHVTALPNFEVFLDAKVDLAD